MRGLIALAARLYPRSWRRRYANEFDALLADADSSASALVDVLHGAVRAHLRERRRAGPTPVGGPPMATSHAPASNASRFGAAAVLLALPTGILVTLSVLKYVLGVVGPFDAIEPTVSPLVTHPLGEAVVILAPYAALLLAAAPVTRLRLGRQEGRLNVGVEVSAPALNVLAATLSAALIATMLVYYLLENY